MSSNFCGNSDITKVFIIEGGTNVFTGATINGNLTITGDIIQCSTGSTYSIYTSSILDCGSGVTINNAITVTTTDVIPTSDNLIGVGSPSRRFRDINTVSGSSTVWTATQKINTPILDLGLDLSGETRIINANNSIIQDDVLLGGEY